MVNDGGLRKVLQTSELVSSALLSLSEQGLYKNIGGASRKHLRSLSKVSGNGHRSIRMNLARHTSAELKQIITPLIKELQTLDAASVLSLQPSKTVGGATLDIPRGLTVPPIHDRVVPCYNDEGNNIVRYLHVKEVPHKFSVGIFVFPPHTEIPLHDHPGMVVISRVLYGELQVKSYDVVGRDSNIDHLVNYDQNRSCCDKNQLTSTSSPMVPSIKTSFSNTSSASSALPGQKSKYYEDSQVDSFLHAKPNLKPMGVELASHGDFNSSLTISAPNVTCLFPHEGNCHAFLAGSNGAAVLDVLLPPYDSDEDRDCTYYEENEYPWDSITPQQLQGIRESPYVLKPINQPEDFHCLSGKYGSFGSDEKYNDDFPEDDNKQSALCNLS